MRQRSPSYITVRDVALPDSRSTVSDSRGMATVSLSCRTVTTICLSRLSMVGGPSAAEGKNEGGLGAVPGMSMNGRVVWLTGPALGVRGADAGEPPDSGVAGGTVDGERAGGLGGVGCGGGMGRRGLLTQSQSMASAG